MKLLLLIICLPFGYACFGQTKKKYPPPPPPYQKEVSWNRKLQLKFKKICVERYTWSAVYTMIDAC